MNQPLNPHADRFLPLTMPKNERKKRGALLLVIGLMLMSAKGLLHLDSAFLLGGVVFVALGCGDIFYDSRYRRRFR